MSRSYKKNPFLTDHKRRTTKQLKRLANRRVRRCLHMPARNQYKKYTESWDICDYKWRMSRAEAIEWYVNKEAEGATEYFKKRYPTLESWLNYWEKCHRRK